MTLAVGVIALLSLIMSFWAFFRSGSAMDDSIKALQTAQKSGSTTLTAAADFNAVVSSMTQMQLDIQQLQVAQAKIPNTEAEPEVDHQTRQAVQELDSEVNKVWHSIKALKKRFKALESLPATQQAIQENQPPQPGQDQLDKQDYYQNEKPQQ
jgi:hypothetical protein